MIYRRLSDLHRLGLALRLEVLGLSRSPMLCTAGFENVYDAILKYKELVWLAFWSPSFPSIKLTYEGKGFHDQKHYPFISLSHTIDAFGNDASRIADRLWNRHLQSRK